MSSWMEALIVAALVVPMTAYVAGSLMARGADAPADRGPVIISDAPSPTPPPTPRPRRTPTQPTQPTPPTQPTQPTQPTPSVPQDDAEVPIDDNEARVVTPQPTAVDDDDESDDDEDDDRREGDDDDSRTGGADTDDGDD